MIGPGGEGTNKEAVTRVARGSLTCSVDESESYVIEVRVGQASLLISKCHHWQPINANP